MTNKLVKCIDDEGRSDLVVGQIYEVLSTKGLYYTLKGVSSRVLENRFTDDISSNSSGQKFHPTIPSFENGTAVQWQVYLDFVSNDQQSGYQKTHFANDCNRDEAIAQAVLAHLNETLPLKSVAVYQCVFIK